MRACPHCHTPLPAAFGTSASPLISVVGAPGTGKTVYLAVLCNELLNRVRRRFGADVRLVESSEKREDSNASLLYMDGRLFSATRSASDGRREPTVLEWRQARRRGYRSSFLSFFDSAGEDLSTQDRTHHLAYLASSDAVMVLVDPFLLPGIHDRLSIPTAAIRARERPLDVIRRVVESIRITNSVRSRTSVPVPMAVVFCKFDVLFDFLGPDHPLVATPSTSGEPSYDEDEGARTHEYVRSLLYELGADDIDAHLTHNVETFRYFAVSALGAAPDYANAVVNPHGIRPHRVEEPLLWLLSRFGIVPATRPAKRIRGG